MANYEVDPIFDLWARQRRVPRAVIETALKKSPGKRLSVKVKSGQDYRGKVELLGDVVTVTYSFDNGGNRREFVVYLDVAEVVSVSRESTKRTAPVEGSGIL